jgi:hypothetical protein
MFNMTALFVSWCLCGGLLTGVRDHRIFVLIVNFDSEELLDLLCGPHLDSIPRHAFADVDADLTADALVKTNLHIGNHNAHAVRCIARRMFDAVDGAKADAGFTTRAVVRHDDRDLFGFLFLPGDLGRGFRNDRRWIRFFGIVCHLLVHS